MDQSIYDPELLAEPTMPRRRFLKLAIAVFNGLITLILAIPGLGFLLTPILRKGTGAWIEIGRVEDLKASTPRKATFSYVSDAGYSRKEKSGFVWAVKDETAESGLTVFSPICSHTGCNVAWQPSESLFVCPCHEGRYDIDGNVFSGPPPRPLQELPLRIENGRVSIQLAA